MKPTDAIVERIQKLLSLANSDNENEAKMATARANELLIKYNLKLQEVTDRQFDYVEEGIATILTKFFFVKVVIARKHVGYSSGQWATRNMPRAQYQKTIKLVGTAENCQIASYIFSYLNDAFPKLWNEYKLKTGADVTRKVSYYMGLAKGISIMLDETKWRVEKETGLVLVKDKDLEAHIKKTTTGTYGGDTNSEIDPNVVRDGIKDGKNVQLRKPLHDGKQHESGKTLTGKKE
jgi:hypothetical protein